MHGHDLAVTPRPFPTPLARTLAATRSQGRAALAAYLPVGFPDFATSLEAMHQVAEAADVLEVGVPYSDPVMDGDTIRTAAAQALRAGFRIEDAFTAVRELAARSTTALVMTYFQPVHRYGPERFARRLAQAGGSGVIIPDLPVDEAAQWLHAARDHGLDTVFVVAPTASNARLAAICAQGSGMIYAPATMGVTGGQGPLHPGLEGFVTRLRHVTDLPVGVGIGVSTPEQAAAVGKIADTCIVGSAFVRALGSRPGPAGVCTAASLAHRLAEGLRRPLHTAA
ncbi:tryptophan synthase subunit alpha (plasmid) [Streptomyces sp. SDT5-1]|uniref:tryptophan synthase subunit alpha n=1 Tax=Streptomyces sp. SDT5-1 TaxID=3406418 RepID=UPI003FD33CBB